MIEYFKPLEVPDLTVVSPDPRRCCERARAFGKRMNAPLAIIDKRREKPNVAEVMNVVGEVKAGNCSTMRQQSSTPGSSNRQGKSSRPASRSLTCTPMESISAISPNALHMRLNFGAQVGHLGHIDPHAAGHDNAASQFLKAMLTCSAKLAFNGALEKRLQDRQQRLR